MSSQGLAVTHGRKWVLWLTAEGHTSCCLEFTVCLETLELASQTVCNRWYFTQWPSRTLDLGEILPAFSFPHLTL